MNFRYMSLAIRILLLPFLANGQCSNQVFPNNNLQRTGSTDYTYFIIQLPKGQIAGAVGGKQLLDVPDRDFAAGSLKPGYHPFWCSIGFMNDIHCTGNMDACNYPIFNALGGDNGQINSGLVPATVSTFLGTPVNIGVYDPSNTTVRESPPKHYSAVVQNAYLGITTVPSGPAPLAKLMDTLSQDLDVPPVQSALYDIKTYRRILNQVNWSPLVQKCTRNNYYFNSTSNTNLFRTGSVTLYGFSVNPLTGSVLSPISAAIADPTGTLFSGLGALRMTCGQWVGQEFTEDCATAVMNNDKSAWE